MVSAGSMRRSSTGLGTLPNTLRSRRALTTSALARMRDNEPMKPTTTPRPWRRSQTLCRHELIATSYNASRSRFAVRQIRALAVSTTNFLKFSGQVSSLDSRVSSFDFRVSSIDFRLSTSTDSHLQPQPRRCRMSISLYYL